VPLPPSSSSAWQARHALGVRLGEIRKDAGLTGKAFTDLTDLAVRGAQARALITKAIDALG
jgi:hypothetical protein